MQHEPIGLRRPRRCSSAFIAHAPSGLAALHGVPRPLPLPLRSTSGCSPHGATVLFLPNKASLPTGPRNTNPIDLCRPRALLFLLQCLPPSSHTLHLAWLLCSASCARSRASSSLHSGCRPHTLTVLFLTRLHYLPITQHEPIGLCPRRTCFSAFMSHAPSGLAALLGVLRSFPCFRLVPLQAAAHTQRWCSSQRGLTTYPSA
jgi:hypothetical protein